MKTLIVAAFAMSFGSALAGTFSYSLESSNTSIAGLEPTYGLLLTDIGSGKATYNYKIVYTPDLDEAFLGSSCDVTLEHMSTVDGNAVATDDQNDVIASGSSTVTPTTDTIGTISSAGSVETFTMPDGSLAISDPAMTSDLPMTDIPWANLKEETKTVQLTAQADGTYIGYLSIDTNTITISSLPGIAGEHVLIGDIVLSGGL